MRRDEGKTGNRRHVLSIDQGTTSTRAIIFDDMGQAIATAQIELAQHHPRNGWVEHDPEDIWRDVQATMRAALDESGLGAEAIAAIGITNQRETSLIWDRGTGEPIHRAIVWQDRRGAALCARLKEAGHEEMISARTGLLLDPYFSATKLAWLLDNVEGGRARAQAGELAFGTIDSFLLWRLTGGAVHRTDATNASRTLLFDIHTQCWCPTLLDLFGIPAAVLPEVCDSSALFGETHVLGPPIPVAGIAGDQQAALFGQACFAAGSAKATYGTGGFLLLNTGAGPVASGHQLLTTVGYRLEGTVTYAAEGSIFIAGAAVQWLREGLGIVTHASETGEMATRVADNGGVYMVPAFVGLGAPHWHPDARGLIAGLTLDTRAAHIVRAALEAVVYQTADLTRAMVSDGADDLRVLRVDGGMAANDWLCQFLADILRVPVDRAGMLETTALGAAFLAGLATGVWADLDAIAALPRPTRRFEPAMTAEERDRLVEGWQAALRRALA